MSAFLGITIKLYFNDHVPPQFHAEYGDHEALIDIEALSVLDGSLPRPQLRVVLAWATLRQTELRAAWTAPRAAQPLPRIAP